MRSICFAIVTLNLLACGGSSATSETTFLATVWHDDFAARGMSYRARSELGGVDEDGEMPLIFEGGSVPPAQTWEVTGDWPVADDYRLSVMAELQTGETCTGETSFSVPPRLLQVVLDCRAEPSRNDLSDDVVYLVGDTE